MVQSHVVKVTPKDFFLWTGAMIAFYASVFAFVSLVFDYINYVFPDVLAQNGYYASDPYSNSISYEMAIIIVLAPLFLILIWFIRQSIAADNTRRDLWVRRWALFLTLFIAIATVAGDFISLIMYFLNGDLTMRFALKALLLFLVASGVFMHFLADLRGYWDEHAAKAHMMMWAVGVLIIATIASGFVIVGTPWQARLYRYDDQKINDMQSIQWQIVNYWQSKEKLPATLTDLQDPISGFMIPTDPQKGTAYEYRTTGANSFELCAVFNAQTRHYSAGSPLYIDNISTRPVNAPIAIGMKERKPDSWYHGVGRTCFPRKIDVDLYPPLPKNKQM